MLCSADHLWDQWLLLEVECLVRARHERRLSFSQRWAYDRRGRSGLRRVDQLVRVVVALADIRRGRRHALERFLCNAHLIVEHLEESLRGRLRAMQMSKDADLKKREAA